MAHVQYTGIFDTRELAAADWKKLGVEGGSKVVFERFEPYEVSDQVLGVLLELGDFKEVKSELIDDSEDDNAGDKPEGEALQTGIDAAGEGAAATGKTAGKGSKASTKGSTT